MRTFLGLLLLAAHCYPQGVLMADYGPTGPGATTSETVLTTSNVSGGRFFRLGQWTVDGNVFAQPLYVPSVTISSKSQNLLIAVTMNNSVYAFDADNPGTTIWSNLAFATPCTTGNICANGGFLAGGVGCLSTPAVDAVNNLLYVVCENSTPNFILRKINLLTGATISSATISGQVAGTGDVGQGDTTSGSNLLFNAAFETQRAGLLLANGNVYIAFSRAGDVRPWHGWAMAYAQADLSQVGIWCASPNGYGGGIWHSGGPPTADASGNIYLTTGNGCSYDGATCFTNTVVKLSSTLALLDWFEPSNNTSINGNTDADTSSNRVILVPGTNYAAVSAAKDFHVYLLDTNCMGHLQGSSGCSVQQFTTDAAGTPGQTTGAYGAVWMNNTLFVPTTAGKMYAYTLSSGSFNTTAFATLTGISAFPNAQMAGSANSATQQILWLVTSATSAFGSKVAGTLHAYDASTLTELYSSDARTQDSLGSISKFTPPTIANGRVFVATQSGYLAMYGLFVPTNLSGSVTISGKALAQ